MLFNISPLSFCFYREKDVSDSNAFILMTALDQSKAVGFYKRMTSNQNVPGIDKMHCAVTCVLDPICKGFTVNLHHHPRCVTDVDEILTATSTNISVKGNNSIFCFREKLQPVYKGALWFLMSHSLIFYCC